MKSDLDRLMEERGFSGIIVTGSTYNNPVMYYMTNGAKLTEGTILVKGWGKDPVLIAGDMEREEAAKSGLTVVPYSHYDMLAMLKQTKGDRFQASVRLWEAIFEEHQIIGNISLYGREEQGQAIAFAGAFNARVNGSRIVGETSPSIFDMAWLTKDPEEVERIRQVGLKTVEVVDRTAKLLQAHRAEHHTLVTDDGSPLTIGDVKRNIRMWMAELNLDDPEGVIFSIGRDAGIPHSTGEDNDPITLGKTIVYDIFPCEAGGGYYFDFTRTWCVGFAPPEVEKAYRDVRDTFDTLMSEMTPGGLCRSYQQRTCALLEAAGHPTVGSDPKTEKGYVHSLGHGVGLNLHERPYFSNYEGATDTLVPGSVVTVEPGVYYPDEGFGIRIEDTIWINPVTNRLEVLAPYSKDLVLPLAE